jgi:hypothetical protein
VEIVFEVVVDVESRRRKVVDGKTKKLFPSSEDLEPKPQWLYA